MFERLRYFLNNFGWAWHRGIPIRSFFKSLRHLDIMVSFKKRVPPLHPTTLLKRETSGTIHIFLAPIFCCSWSMEIAKVSTCSFFWMSSSQHTCTMVLGYLWLAILTSCQTLCFWANTTRLRHGAVHAHLPQSHSPLHSHSPSNWESKNGV